MIPRVLAAGVLLTAGTVGIARAQTVNVWLTTDSQSAKLQSQPSVTFVAGNAGSNSVFVDETQVYQQIEGFGASFTDSAAYLLKEVATASARSNAMHSLFTRNVGGIGVSFVRNPMGASDLARYHYSYDDLPAGQTDVNLTNFSIAHDEVDIIPLLQEALQLNPQLKIMANPWSPPGWMKSSGSMIGGSLLAGMYAPFANYFVKYVQAYEAAGIPIHYLSLQNEPLYVPPDYPGMSMDAATQLIVLRDYVLPALAWSNISSRVLVYDHNWDRPDYPETVFGDATIAGSSLVAGTAWHGYGGTPGAMLTLANRVPTKGNYETEHSGGTWVTDQVKSDFEEIIHVMRSWGRSYVKWSLALDQNHGPNAGGCSTCNPLVTVNTLSGAVSYNIDFYTLGHFSKFVLPGAFRIYSANAPGVLSAAFLNPDGSKALVVFNDTPNNQRFQVQWGDKQFSYSLAGFAGATFTWTGTQAGNYALDPSVQIQASSFNSILGLQTEPTSDTLGGYDVGYAANGDYLLFKNVNFPAGVYAVTARVASAGTGGSLDFRLDAPSGKVIGTATIPVTGGWQTWTNVSGAVSGAVGLHNLYVVFRGTTSIGNVNWFRFSVNQPPALAPIASRTILAGRTLTITNSATDPESPPETLTFSLPLGPVGSSINSNSGVFSWRPAIAQSPSTQTVAVAVFDNGTPVMSATQSFTVTVERPVAPTIGLAGITNGQFGFWINGDTGPDYLIQSSTNLQSWSTVSLTNSPALPYSWSDTNSSSLPVRFFRTVLGP